MWANCAVMNLQIIQAQDASIYPVLMTMISNKRNQLEVDHSLTFMKFISQHAGNNVACGDVLADMLVILLMHCNGISTRGQPHDGQASRTAADTEAQRGRIVDGEVAETLREPVKDAMKTKAAAVIRNLASNAEFCQTICQTDGLLAALGEMLSSCPHAGYRQALGAICNLAAFERGAGLILSFPKINEGDEMTSRLKENTIVADLLSLTQSSDTWTCVQSIIALQNLLEHDIDFQMRAGGSTRCLLAIDMRVYEQTMVDNFQALVLGKGDVAMQVRVKAALALASLTSRESACALIASLPDNKDTRMFGFLLGLDRPDALPEEIKVALWALSNVAALDVNTENKFLQVDFLLDRLGRCAATGSSEQRVAAAAVIRNLCPHSAISAEYIGALTGVVASLHELALSKDLTVCEHALGALCNLTTECTKNRVIDVGDCQLKFSKLLIDKSCQCLAEDDDMLKVYGAGLICNMAASGEGKDSSASIGRSLMILPRLVECLFSSNGEVRINALSALCNLAHNEMNKIHIGQVPRCLERLNSLLESGNDSEKAQTCMLVFYLSFAFKNNAMFGELSGAVDRIVQLLTVGNDEQIENAAAALSILACNKKNAEMLTSEEKRPAILQTLSSTLRNGNSQQQVNVVVCMWNLSASSAVAKVDIGKLPSIFVNLVDILKRDRAGELAQQTVGLLAELLHGNERNAMLFGKVDQGIETLLDLSFETSLPKVTELNACWGITNFAASDDERLRRVAEMEGGLTAMSRMIERGVKKQQEYACQALASDVLKSQAGRKKIARVPKLLDTLVTVCTNFEDNRRRYSAQILSNLAAGPSTRQALSKVDHILKALETAVADPMSDKWSQFYATRCMASLCLDPQLCDELVDWECTHGLLLSNLKSEDRDLVDAAAEAFHNLLASHKDNREVLSENREIMDRIVELAGEEEGHVSAMHAVGSLFQLVRASKEFAKEIANHEFLVPQLVKALKHGGDKGKELACAILAILGENDDDIESLHDDVLNMQIAMCDGSFDALQDLLIRGSPQQAMHATAVLSNLILSAGSFMKTQLAENEDLLAALMKFCESSPPLHRTYAIRLLYLMMKDDYHIISLVGKLSSTLPVLMELLDTGNSDQRLYACGCMVQLASVEELTQPIGSYNSGHVFKIVLQILLEKRSPLKGAALEIMRFLTVDEGNKMAVLRVEGLIDYLAQVSYKGSQEHSTSASGILKQLSTSNKDLRAVLASAEMPLAALEHLLQMTGTARQNAAVLIFNLLAEADNTRCLIQIPNLFDTLANMIIHGDDLDQHSACSAMWKLLMHSDKGLKDMNKASQVVKQLVFLMEEDTYTVEREEQEQIMLSTMLQMCKDEYGCSVISLVPGIFRMLIHQSNREGHGDGHPWIALSIMRSLIQGNSTCWSTMIQEPGSISTLLAAMRVSNASMVRDALSILELLSNTSREFQPQIIETNKDKGDVWDTLLSFVDENLMDESIFTMAEYNVQRQRAFGILTMLAKRNQVACDRITQKRVSTDIIARGIINVGGSCRESAMQLSIECSAMNSHFTKKLGNERGLIKALTSALGATADANSVISSPFSTYQKKLALSLLSCLCTNELHCQTVGGAPGFSIALLTIIHDGSEDRKRESAGANQTLLHQGGDGSAQEGEETEAIWKSTAERLPDGEENKALEPFEQAIADGLLRPDVADDIDDSRHLDVEAANLMRVLIHNNNNCNTFVRVPYPLAETLVIIALSQQQQQRKHALSILWTVATTSKFGLELLGKKATPLLQALFTICLHRKEHIEEVLPLLADLMHEKKCKLAMLANVSLLGLLVEISGNADSVHRSATAIRTIECLAHDFNEGKHVLGELQDLMRTLTKLKYTGPEALATAATAAMEQLARNCDANAGIFRRLRVEYAR